jgi:hypothetical protein
MPMPQTPLSPAGAALGLGDLLKQDVESKTDRLRRLRQAQAMGRPDLAGGLGYGSSVLGGPASALGLMGRVR